LIRLRDDEVAAATEIGYLLTFLLGLMFLTSFSLWTWDIQQATDERWTEEAMEENVRSISRAIERADAAARLDAEAVYAEPIPLLLSASTGLGLRLLMTNDSILLTDKTGERVIEQPISGAANTWHHGEVNLAGAELLWVSLTDGEVIITLRQPGF
jgi:hypothetical protein